MSYTKRYEPGRAPSIRIQPHPYRWITDRTQCVRCNLPESNTRIHVESDPAGMVDVQRLAASERVAA